ncbi:Fe-S cluster assembly protein SufD [Tenuibacillus multivorans]|uniref:Fe-S cluster assembly protein SufD n=1 Tax=Tenuibacillus multivorans TaxID=237069 RepID=A0A1H0DAB2_9BACI|nr:Fe-S cluster assembly protein SufD [Tenuibacillus multivorans]GEL76641.1 FeS cluster assembly protein SufD [Tenuibacillus multivorans]SDN66911.1 Fe-S cluster assembly protein SufD [Tenuibacillus multivorans]
MTVETQLPYDKDYLMQYSERRKEPQWFRDVRLNAIETAENLAMPKLEKTRLKNWNFTNFKHDVSGEAVQKFEELPEKIRVLLGEKSTSENLIIVRNNDVAHASLSPELQDKGVVFKDIFTAMNENEDLVKKYFMQDGVSVDEHKLTARHAALLNSGVFLYVPKNVKVEEPIQIVFWQEDPEAALFNHVLLVADQHSEVTYLENYVSENKNEEAVANIVSEVFALDGANVSYGAVDNFEKGTTTYVNRRGVAQRDATIEWALGQMNDGNTISDNVTYLMGDNSYSYAKAVSVGRGDQKQDFTAKIVHYGKESEGYILQHGVMKDNATSIFNGIGKIEHGATKANAEQESRVLMLDQGSRGDANPILLIDEDDVTAGHAASVGRVDPIQLYYLMSRGISQQEAERLVIHGFLSPVVREIPIETVQAQLREVIEGKVY